MGSKERRERERTETREKILEAAREMFVEHGYEQTTMRGIARRIEYTPTAIYHHFKDKESMLAEICAIDFLSLAAAFQGIGHVADPIERIERIGAAYIEFGMKHPKHYQLMFMTQRPDTPVDLEHGDPAVDAYAFLVQTCEEALAAGRFRPEFNDAEQIAQMLWATVHGFVSLHIVMPEDEWLQWKDSEDTAARLRQAILRGLTLANT